MGATTNNEKIQQHNHHLRTDSCLSHWVEGRLNAFYWYQTFVLDSAVVTAEQLFSSHGKTDCFC